MTRGKDHTKERKSKLDSSVSKFMRINSQSAIIRSLYNQNESKKEKQKDINKEIIRRLKIQNKKLIERVSKLKEEIKKTRMNKTQILSHINELLRLINK